MSEGKGAYKTALTAATVTDGGAVLSLANPESVDLIVTRLVLNITTEATGAAAVDAGIAADGETSSDTLLDGLDVGSAAGVFDNFDDQGTNGQSCVTWDSDEYLTITASATLAGLVGDAYIEYIRA